MKKLLYIFPLPLLMCLASCEEHIDTWSGRDRIRFATAAITDTLKNYSFVFESGDLSRYTFWLEVQTEGKVCDYPRPVNIKQVPSTQGNDAVAGIHYVAFDRTEVKTQYVIPAGVNKAQIPIVLLRDESLQNSEKNLRIVLEVNEAFLLSGDVNAQHRTIIFADILSMPQMWGEVGSIRSFFGSYGPEKHRFMIEVAGQSFDDDYFKKYFYWYSDVYGWQPNSDEHDYLEYLQGWLQRKLEERNGREGNILTEADGTVVDFYV